MVGLISAALSLSMMVTAAPPRPVVRNAAFVTAPAPAEAPALFTAIKHARKSVRRGTHASTAHANSPMASSSGCYEVTPSFTLIPCGHPH